MARERRDERKLTNDAFRTLLSEMSELVRKDIANTVSGLNEKNPDLVTAFEQANKLVKVVTASRKSTKNEAIDPAAPDSANQNNPAVGATGQNTATESPKPEPTN